jgi:uncharacterized surface protein with fasciclin (FAS1) repeats
VRSPRQTHQSGWRWFFKIDKAGNGFVITDGRNRTSNIIQTDIAASNGVIHAIDKVLLPGDKNIVQTAIANPDFSILVEAVTAAGLLIRSVPPALTPFSRPQCGICVLVE